MRTFVALSALAGLALASPAPQMPDLGSFVAAAPTVAAQNPPVGDLEPTYTYDRASADSHASTAVTGITTPTATLDKRHFGWGWGNNDGKTSSSSTSTSCTTSTSSSTSTSCTTSTTSTTSKTSTHTATSATTPFVVPTEAPCGALPDGFGPVPFDDTVDGFYAYPEFQQESKNAKAPSTYVEVFKGLNASIQANSYLTYHNLHTYDVTGCSQWCDNTTTCTSFNIYVERDPSINPNNATCLNPPSITNYKCALYGSSITADEATNVGGWRGKFHVVITGSNGYDKTPTTTPPTCDGWNKPGKPSSGGAINKPSCNIGQHFFPGPYDPSLCASYAQAQTIKNKASVSIWNLWRYQPCNFFNAYQVKLNGKHQGTFCSLYNTPVSFSFATYFGIQKGGSNVEVETSFTYELSSQQSGYCWLGRC